MSQDPNERIPQLERALVEMKAALDDARREAARYRVGSKGVLDETAQSLAELLGLDTSTREGRPDVPTMARKLATENRELKIRAALADGMHRKGLKPGLTRAYLIDTGAMQRLDPTAEDFAEQIDTALSEAKQQEPGLHEQQVGPWGRSAELTGGNGLRWDQPYTRQELAAMRPEEVVELRRSGQLRHLGLEPPRGGR